MSKTSYIRVMLLKYFFFFQAEDGIRDFCLSRGLGTSLRLYNRFTVDAFLEHQGGFYVQNYTAYQNARRGAWYPCYDTQEKVISSYGPDMEPGTSDDVASALSGVTALMRARCSSSDYDIGFWTEKGD